MHPRSMKIDFLEKSENASRKQVSINYSTRSVATVYLFAETPFFFAGFSFSTLGLAF